jgi:hypothetical protein
MIKSSHFNFTNNVRETTIVGVGTTMYTGEESVRVMSDIWEYQYFAYFWNRETKHMDKRAISWEYQSAEDKVEYTIDADYETIFAEMYDAYYDAEYRKCIIDLEKVASKVAVKGTVVKVVKGKTSVGTEGKVVAVLPKAYGNHYYAPMHNKVAIALDDEMTTFVAKNGKTYPTHKNVVWVWDINCQVVNVNIDHNSARETAKYRAQQLVENVKSFCNRHMAVVA